MTTPSTPEPTSIERLREVHQQLLSHIATYTGTELARLRELNPAEAGVPNRALRESHQVFAVPHVDTWHYPRFQFEPNGKPCEHATQLMSALGVDVDPWDLLRWFVEPNPKLDGVAPIDKWAEDPAKIIDLARRSH
jgi:hypothetical protein